MKNEFVLVKFLRKRICWLSKAKQLPKVGADLVYEINGSINVSRKQLAHPILLRCVVSDCICRYDRYGSMNRF